MENKFQTICEESEQTNMLLKKIETILAQSRQELLANLKRMEDLASDVSTSK